MRREGGVVSVSRQRGFIVAAGDNQYTKSPARRSQNRVRAKRVTELCKVRSGNAAGPVARQGLPLTPEGRSLGGDGIGPRWPRGGSRD